MTIKQGDAYSIMISLKDDSGEPITDAVVGSAEVVLGGITKTYPEDVTYDSDGKCFVFPLVQTESHALTGIIPAGVFFHRNWARLSALAAGTIFAIFLLFLLFADAEHGYHSFNASARLVLFFWWIPRVVTMLLLLLPRAKTIGWHKRGLR